MFTTLNSFRETATLVAASAVCTTLAFAVSTSPTRAATPSGFVNKVESQLADTANYVDVRRSGVATVAVKIDGDGNILDAKLVGSTGHAALDNEAVRSATSVTYPKSGKARTVAVVLRFGDVNTPSRQQTVKLVMNQNGQTRLATTNTAPIGG